MAAAIKNLGRGVILVDEVLGKLEQAILVGARSFAGDAGRLNVWCYT